LKLIVDLENINLASVNKKYVNKNFALSNEYRNFKDAVSWSAKAHLVDKEFDALGRFKMLIEFSAATDIDNVIKPVIDGVFRVGILEADDKNVLELIVKKKPIKRGKLGSIQVYLEQI
jgi:Holliday junction resolvase RusA-like endonuclease